MSRRRSRPSEINASARFDLLRRVIVAAFTSYPSASGLILDRALLINSTAFTLPVQANPRSQQPASNKTAQNNKEAFPKKERHQTIRNGAAHNGIERNHKEKV